MHVETMSRSPIGMCLPLDQPPASSPNAHAFPPFPSPESECIPNWLQFDSLPTPTHYSNSYGAPVAIPLDNTQTSCSLSSGERFLELDKNPCVDSWEDQQRPLPSFPQSLGRAKRRALDLACITRASPTGLHRPYSPTTFHSFSPPPPSGCYGHLSANNLCWAEQVSDNHVVVSQNEGLCMLVESQETYSRCEDYGNADSNVVMEILAEHNPFHQSCAESYPCHGIGMEGGVLLEEEEEEGGSRGEDGEVEGRVGQWEETEEEEELDEEAVEEEEEKPVVEPVECGSRGAWKRGRRRGRRRRRKQSNESDGETATDDNVFLPEEDDGQCSLPSSPTTLICRWSDCNSIFGDQSALVRHIEKTHVDARSRGGGGSGGSSGRGCSGGGTGGAFGEEFACHWHLCPRRTRPFNARYKLLIHMRVHSGDKPNKCPYEGCPKAFSRLENLKIHQRSHTGERPYSCQFPLCPKAFSNSSDRAKHQRTHFDTKPYACQVAGCSKRYTDPSSLRKHVKNHSPKDQTQARRKLKSVEASSSPPAQNREPKSMSSMPQEMSYLSGTMQQDYNSEMSSSSASIKENAMDKDEFIDAVKMEGMSVHNLDNADGDYSQADIIEYSSQTPEDELFFDCFQSLESIRPLLSSDKESVLTTDLQNSAQFELSLDLDCAEVQQDFLEIGVLEKWGVTGANIVGCTSVDDSLDSDFLTIS